MEDSKSDFQKNCIEMEVDVQNCLECNKVYSSLKNLSAHNRAVHTINVSICDICSNAFKHADALKQHTRIVHESNEVTCDQCGKTVTNKTRLWHHILQVHDKSEDYIYMYVPNVNKMLMSPVSSVSSVNQYSLES